ncbi:DUF7284 family protein [Natronobeatus ordinarius]|uniref:DUF7284 family protein n=1 Tax=Natronobeatus ordinarius TaxID=2963433 RepID=UPI0020CB7BF4|nr:hypothetical protein [Natronobeatus ordinarius]
MVTDDRAISTVMDVALALLIVSTSVLLIGVYLHSDDESIGGDRGDHAIQTLSGSTVTITYDLRAENEAGNATTDSKHYDHPDLDPDEIGELYQITTYGSAADLLGEAALVNLQINDTKPFAYGYDVERSVDAAIRDRLVGSEGRTYAIATWEPYEGASINGTATAGDRPPRTADVSSSTMAVSSTVPPVEAKTLAESFVDGQERSASRSGIEDGFDLVGEDIAHATVEGYFPPEATQYTLESTLTENSMTLYNYRTLADATGADVEDHVTGTSPNAIAANEALAGTAGDDEGLAAVIADDMRDSPAGEQIEEAYAELDDDVPTEEKVEALESEFDAVVSTGTIKITVQTWDR